MNILFLDDNVGRQRHFRWDLLPRDAWGSSDHAFNAKKAIEFLGRDAYELVFLDHDLEGEYQDPSEENTGSGVVRWICEHRPEVKRFVVHSMNEQEANNMVAALIENGYEAEAISFYRIARESPERDRVKAMLAGA